MLFKDIKVDNVLSAGPALKKCEYIYIVEKFENKMKVLILQKVKKDYLIVKSLLRTRSLNDDLYPWPTLDEARKYEMVKMLLLKNVELIKHGI